ncbi:uncharacterized protein LOC116002034 [Ipomoea triloba]|uniref:uncharacterized protein LOC116002034 n=1 Tax=Ipomoea triloba TaxID=35885 RepID=UPI00125CE2B2|nr:uncharacterized protein LOC116002034 [Ipomoea triloba]
MGSLLLSATLTLLFLASAATLSTTRARAQAIQSSRLLDLVIRDYTFRSYNHRAFKTGKLHPIHLPANLTGIDVDSVRFRCGSLGRYGARIKEFRISVGVTFQRCVERLLIVRQNLGSNWSNIYYDNYEMSGYQLISPVLGLLAYNAAGDDISIGAGTPFEVGIQTGGNPITIDFSNTTRIVNSTSSPGMIPLCASFGRDGKVTLSNMASRHVCVTRKQGHFGLVVESPLMPLRKKESRWKIVIGSAIGAALGAFLIGLLLVAIFVKVKNKQARMEDMVRRAYEEEALQVSMVGHVRAPTAPATRTVPTIEHEYTSPHHHHPS